MDGARLLLVDDEPQLLELLSLILHQRGYEVRMANSCAAALTLARAEHFRAAVLDAALPLGEGLAAARALRELPNAPRIVFLTDPGDPSSASRAAQLGDACLPKPFRPADLLALLGGLTGHG